MTIDERVRTALESATWTLPDPILLPASEVVRRGTRRRRTRQLRIGVVVAMLVVGFAVLVLPSDPTAPAGPGLDLANVPTPAEILADGRVTEEEFNLAGRAVVQCLSDQGFEAEFDPEEIGFEVIGGEPLTDRGGALKECIATYIGRVFHVWLNEAYDPVADFMFYQSVVECTSDLTGADYGEMTQDPMGFMSTEAHRTINRASAESPSEWDDCYHKISEG